MKTIPVCYTDKQVSNLLEISAMIRKGAVA